MATQSSNAGLVTDSVEVAWREGEPPLRIEPASGLTYRVIAHDATACRRIAHNFLEYPAAELVPHAGGLLANLSVLENVLLPVVYHRGVNGAELEALVYAGFQACGVDREGADALCARSAFELDRFERRLVAVVRSLLMRPSLLVLERLFEGLAEDEMERAALFSSCYRRVVDNGTLVYLDVAGMPGPVLIVDVRAEGSDAA